MVEFRPVKQLIMLAAGRYRFKGIYKGETIGRRGLQWRVACAGETLTLGESGMGGGLANAWKAFNFEFTVPQAGCRAQYSSLALDARSASEQILSGSLWYSGLRIERIAQHDAGD